jgi:Phage integrase, N-terminal SAM-like domain
MLLLGRGARFSEGTAGKRTNTGAGDDVSQSCFRLRMSATELVLPRSSGRAKLGGAGGLGMLPSGGAVVAVVVVEHAAQALAPLPLRNQGKAACSQVHFAKELSMTPLHQRMTEDMQVRNLSPHTQTCYVQQVSLFARQFQRSPEVLGPEEIRFYEIYGG